MVKGGIEDRNLRNAWQLAENLLCCKKVEGIVQRCQEIQLVNLLQDGGAQQYRGAETLATVDNTMPHCMDITDAIGMLGDGRQSQLYGLTMIRGLDCAGPPILAVRQKVQMR